MSENRPKPYLGNPQETIAVLNRYKFAFQKKFGQNFLIDTHVLERIIDEAGITPDDFVLEIECRYRNHDTVSCLRSP